MPQGPINLGIVMSAHAKFKRANSEAITREMEGVGRFGVGYVTQHPTFKHRTHNLEKSTSYKIVRLKSGSVIRMMNSAKYAKFVEYGTKPHMIYPRRAKMLRFTVRGKIVFAHRVRHPGTKPLKFLYRATYAAGRVFETSMRARMNVVARSF